MQEIQPNLWQYSSEAHLLFRIHSIEFRQQIRMNLIDQIHLIGDFRGVQASKESLFAMSLSVLKGHGKLGDWGERREVTM